MTQTGETPASPTTGRDPAVSGLFHMSRTAGVGLQDYAAINVLAVTGLLLGVASFLAVIVPDTLAILIVPLAAAVVSVLAFVQVRRSNGTQTGKFLAIGGLALAILFAGIHVYGYAKTASTERQWTAELNQLVAKLRPAGTTQGAEGAYPLFDDRFREQVTAETFARQMQPRMRVVEKIRVGDLVVYTTDESGVVNAQTLLLLSGTGHSPEGEARPFSVEEPIEFRKPVGQPWQIHGITGWFGATKAAGAAGAPGAAGSPAAGAPGAAPAAR
jgi:hypothetical protein